MIARPGQVLKVRGSGFTPGTLVNLTWGVSGRVKPVLVTPSGALRTYLHMPSSREGGNHAAITVADGEGTFLAYTDFLVEAPPLQRPSFKSRSRPCGIGVDRLLAARPDGAAWQASLAEGVNDGDVAGPCDRFGFHVWQYEE